MANSCKGCTDRVLGCHGTCERYAVYKEELEKAKQRRWEDNIALDDKSRVIYKILKAGKWKK